MADAEDPAAAMHGTTPSTDGKSLKVNDWRFVRQLLLLRDLHSFLLFSGENVAGKIPSGIRFSAIEHSRRGVAPTVAQWQEVDTALEQLFPLLQGPLRQKFLLSQFAPWMPRLAVICLGGIVASLVSLVVFTVIGLPYVMDFFPYVAWLASMGALGAISFVAMNVLSVQQDVTFDLNNSRLLAVRIIVGAVFGVVLALPFSYTEFVTFGRTLGGYDFNAPPAALDWRQASQQALFFFLPFMLGFSTTLVMVLLNRLVSAAQTLVGSTPANPASSK